MLNHPSRRMVLKSVLAGAAMGTSWVGVRAQDPAPPGAGGEFPPPEPVPPVVLGPTLKTHPVRRNARGFVNPETGQKVFNERWVDAAVLPRDRNGIWVLDFAFKPLRILTVDIPGKGRRDVHYLYYQVVNRTGQPRMFVPQFTLVTDTGKRFEDNVIPNAVKVIAAREDPTIPDLLGAVSIMGMIPPSTKQGIDDAVFGVAVWEGIDPKADKLTIYIRGLSDGYREDAPTEPNGKPVVRYKTLQIDMIRRGDEHDLHEREITLLDPPYDWTYR